MNQRPKQMNCQNEPAYPSHVTVLFSIGDPELTGHAKHKDCPIEEPHKISECGMFRMSKSV